MLYTVYIAVDEDRADEWEDWMDDVHIPDVIDTGCFEHATLARSEAGDTPHRRAYRVVYVAWSEEAFDEYQSDHAAALQADHTERYEGAFEASRDILSVIARYGAVERPPARV